MIEKYPKIEVEECYEALVNDCGVIREDLTREGLHLNDYGYRVLTDCVKRKL